MNFFAFIIALVAITSVTTIINTALRLAGRKYRYKDGFGEVTRLESLVSETNAEVDRLRKRVAVLEKLLTDDDRRLANEIDRLQRDEARF
jgi:hypothetical protein